MGQNRISYKTRQLLLSKRWDAVFYTDRRVTTVTVNDRLLALYIGVGSRMTLAACSLVLLFSARASSPYAYLRSSDYKKLALSLATFI